MKLAIIGSRDFNDHPRLIDTILDYYSDGVFGKRLRISEIISGGAAGADSLGAKFAKENNIKLTVFLPDWNAFGKRAGFIRNRDIIVNCNAVLAFWDGASKGTQNSLSIAKELKKDTLVIYF